MIAIAREAGAGKIRKSCRPLVFLCKNVINLKWKYVVLLGNAAILASSFGPLHDALAARFAHMLGLAAVALLQGQPRFGLYKIDEASDTQITLQFLFLDGRDCPLGVSLRQLGHANDGAIREFPLHHSFCRLR